jgi:hypothetical protein
MRLSLILCRALLPALLAGGVLLAGCNGSIENRSIPAEFAGDYAGKMTAVPGGTVGVIRATIFPSGSVTFEVRTAAGSFFATGGIAVSNQLTAFGFLGGAQVEFVGTWTADGFGAAAGTWVDRSSDTSGTWSITQQGVTVPAAVGGYTGSYVLPGFIGTVTFDIDADGSIDGLASGLQLFDTPLAGSLTRDNLLVLAGTTGLGGTGAAVFFVGELNTTSFTVTDGAAGTSLAGGVTGAWTAVKTPPG